MRAARACPASSSGLEYKVGIAQGRPGTKPGWARAALRRGPGLKQPKVAEGAAGDGARRAALARGAGGCARALHLRVQAASRGVS